MNTPRSPFPVGPLLARTLFALVLGLVLATESSAQAPSPEPVAASRSALLTGQVLRRSTGEAVEGARLRIAGSTLETFSDADGRFAFPALTDGPVRVQVFFTGVAERTEEIGLRPGLNDRTLYLDGTRTAADGTVELDAFVVTSSREMDAAAIAINEQRFANTIKNVLSTDEFGFLAEGNAAEFLKYMPGITIDATGGNSRDISINGVTSAFVPITVEGFNLASAGVELNTSRSVAMDMVSVNNLARIEVIHAPLADQSGSALAGSVNLVPRSAFERIKPVFNYRAFLMGRGNEFDFDETPGPDREASRKVNPGFELSWINPVNKRFGYTVSAGYSRNYSPEPLTQMRWHGSFSATAAPGTLNPAFPATTPDQPYLTNYVVRDAGKITGRASLGTTLDFKPGKFDRVSLGFQYSHFDLVATNQTLEFPIDRVASFVTSPTTSSTVSAAGQSRLQLTNLVRHRTNETLHPTLVWYHNGPNWQWKAGIGYSTSENRNRDVDKGAFAATTASRGNVTVTYDNVSYERPGAITVRDNATGQIIDPFAITGKNLASASSAEDTVQDTKLTAYADLTRPLDWRYPIRLKGGLRFESTERDNRGTSSSWTYLGPDLNAATPDSAAPFLDAVYAAREGQFGFPTIQGVSNYLAYDALRANPAQFRLDENAQYRSRISNSRNVVETISAGYVQGEIDFFQRRLKLVAGVRAEQTNIEAQAALLDPTRNFQRDASGNILRATNGQPLLIKPTSDALGVSQLTFLERANNSEKEYFRVLPRFAASYLVRDNLIVRLSSTTSLGRPNFVQYAGALTLPNTDTAPGPNNFIFVNNPSIKAWTARALAARVEYYFEKVGQISVGAFRRDYEDFFGGTRFLVTPEFLEAFELDPALYTGYDVQTQVNIDGKVRHEGLTLDYKQALTFLPYWARGVQVFGNASRVRRSGPPNVIGNLNPYRDSASWGVSLNRSRYNVRLNWNYRAERRNSTLTGNSIEPETYSYSPERLTLDFDTEIYLRKNFALFVNGRNVTDEPELQEVYGPSTPTFARMRLTIPYGALWTFGLRGSF